MLTLTLEQKQDLSNSTLGRELLNIIETHALTAVFQPIIDLKTREIFAHEALIRGPKNSFLHSPLNLLQVAEDHDCLFEVDWLARLASIHSFQHQQGKSLLFLNVTVNTLMQKTHRSGITLEYLDLLGIPISQVVIEITELQPVEDYQAFVKSVAHYREMGFKVAIDDLGAGYNGLRIWSEVKPDFVKIDHHFISNIHKDKDKLHFLETISLLAKKLGTKIIAEGVEQFGELDALTKLDIDYVQGYLLKRPESQLRNTIEFDWHNYQPNIQTIHSNNLEEVLEHLFTINPHSKVMDVARFFIANPHISYLPVIQEEKIYGVILRERIMTHIVKALEYFVEAEQSLASIIETETTILPIQTSIQQAIEVLVNRQDNKNCDYFIISKNGKYAGCGNINTLLAKYISHQDKLFEKQYSYMS